MMRVRRMAEMRGGAPRAHGAAWVWVALVVLSIAARAQAAADSRLDGRLDAATAAQVDDAIERARAKGLPVDPLVARALEGASRQAPGPRIAASVRALAFDLETARMALGDASTPAELVAGATAVASGVRPDTLARLRSARGRESVVVPLVVLTDLVTRRVPVETASAAVLAASRAQVKDPELMRLRERIHRDIQAGTPPGNATIARTRNLIGAFEGPPATRRPTGAGGP